MDSEARPCLVRLSAALQPVGSKFVVQVISPFCINTIGGRGLIIAQFKQDKLFVKAGIDPDLVAS